MPLLSSGRLSFWVFDLLMVTDIVKGVEFDKLNQAESPLPVGKWFLQ